MRIISGVYKGRAIKSFAAPGRGPKGYRPAASKVHEAVFSMLEARGLDWPRTRVLDLFAGTGSLGLEDLSRGAPFVMFVEKNKKAALCIEKNLGLWAVEKERFKVRAKDLFEVLKTGPEHKFGLVFIDPPYYKDLLAPALEKIVSGPWLGPGGFVLAEVEAGASLTLDTIPPELILDVDRKYGQTRILLWTNTIP